MWGCTGRKGGVELVRVRSQRRSHGVAVQVCSCTGRKGEVALVRVRSQRRSDGVAVLWSCGHSVAEMVSRCSGR